MYVDHAGIVRAKSCVRNSQLADMSLVSLTMIIAGLKKSTKMVKYNDHSELNRRMPNYQV